MQEIKVKWTKLSRGAPHSARRNAVPSILPLAPIDSTTLDTDNPTIIHHQITFDEYYDFIPHETTNLKVVNPPNRRFKFGCLHPQFSADHVEIIFTYSYYCGGAPDRSGPPKTVLTLHTDEWGQIIYNGRFSRGYAGDWYYQQFVFNIALSTNPSAFDPTLFSALLPTKVYKNLVHLR